MKSLEERRMARVQRKADEAHEQGKPFIPSRDGIGATSIRGDDLDGLIAVEEATNAAIANAKPSFDREQGNLNGLALG